MPESLITKFGSILVNEEWEFLTPDMSPTDMVNEFEDHASRLVENTFPEKTVKISSFDKPYFTEELRQIRRQRQRVYRKYGRSDKYLRLKGEFNQKLKLEARKYHEKIITALRKLESAEIAGKNSTFTLSQHADDDPTSLE